LLERAVVWAGGLAFVGSLAVTAWWYIVWLGQVSAFAGWGPVVFDALLFSGFALHHSILARPSIKAAAARIFPERLLRSVYVWTASLLLMLVCLLWRSVGGEVFHETGPLAILHTGAQVAGFALIALSVRAIDALELAGIRTGRSGQDLQITGPYHVVRHPLYLGWILVVFGAAHLTGDRFAFAAISSLYLMMAVPWEERSLEREFGEEYRRYKQQVRWRIIPYVY
jgi:protein-S-isoprenylcysteine O-methyltransferase Ste14